MRLPDDLDSHAIRALLAATVILVASQIGMRVEHWAIVAALDSFPDVPRTYAALPLMGVRVLAVMVFIVILVGACLAAWWTRDAAVEVARRAWPPRWLVLALAFGTPLLLVFAINWVTGTPTVASKAFPPEFPVWVIAPWVVMAFGCLVLKAALEEYVVRGVLLDVLRPLGLPAAVVLSAAMFMALHQNPNVGTAVIRFVGGLMFAYVVVRSGSLWPAIGLHAGVNTVAALGHSEPFGFDELGLAATGPVVDYSPTGGAFLATLLSFVVVAEGAAFCRRWSHRRAKQQRPALQESGPRAEASGP